MRRCVTHETGAAHARPLAQPPRRAGAAGAAGCFIQPMLFDSSIRKALARSFGATLVVLVTVGMTMMLIRTLGQAARGSVSPSDVMLVMGFTVVGQLPTITARISFFAVGGPLRRVCREREMVIWFASGRGLASLVRPLLRFAWPVMLVIAVLSLLVWPWANAQIQ